MIDRIFTDTDGINRSDMGQRLVSFILAAFIISLLILIPILGCLGGGWYGVAWNSGAAVGWKPLEPLPQKANEILSAGTGLSNYSWFVYVRTTNQKVYFCASDACWIEKTVEPEALQANMPCDRPANFEVPSPPGQVIDSREVQAFILKQSTRLISLFLKTAAYGGGNIPPWAFLCWSGFSYQPFAARFWDCWAVR